MKSKWDCGIFEITLSSRLRPSRRKGRRRPAPLHEPRHIQVLPRSRRTVEAAIHMLVVKGGGLANPNSPRHGRPQPGPVRLLEEHHREPVLLLDPHNLDVPCRRVHASVWAGGSGGTSRRLGLTRARVMARFEHDGRGKMALCLFPAHLRRRAVLAVEGLRLSSASWEFGRTESSERIMGIGFTGTTGHDPLWAGTLQ